MIYDYKFPPLGIGCPREGIFLRKRDLIIVLSALVIAILMGIFVVAPGAIETGSWVLSFPAEGEAPHGPASTQALKKFDAAYLGDTSKKVLYLTFDAGYENGNTAKILDILKKHNVPAAFFLVGNYIEKNPDLVRRMADEGHIVGNHTMHHYDMSKISDKAAFQKELRDLEALYQQVTGREMPKFYRPPQGIYSESNLKMAQELGYKTVFWSLAYVDWNNDSQPTAEQAYAKLLPRIHNGAVVLLHSTSQTNAEILDDLLTKWKDMGYTFASIDEVFPGGG
jgi:peptidoglycan-N-acetylmuramic acid deacetylase